MGDSIFMTLLLANLLEWMLTSCIVTWTWVRWFKRLVVEVVWSHHIVEGFSRDAEGNFVNAVKLTPLLDRLPAVANSERLLWLKNKWLIPIEQTLHLILVRCRSLGLLTHSVLVDEHIIWSRRSTKFALLSFKG